MRRTGSNILAPGLRPEGLSDSPFSRLHRCSEHGHSTCAPSGHYVRFLASAELELRWAHRLQVVFHSQTIGLWEIVSSYSSATAPASHRISRADPLFQTRKELSEQ